MNSILNSTRPKVLYLGDTEHADFRDAAKLLRAEADLMAPTGSPELIVVAHSRPGAVSADLLNSLRHASPLAGVVVLAGSWCEGELRTGRPWPGVRRLYWYEFPAWWQQQLAVRAAGYCPDWLRPEEQINASISRATRSTWRAPGIILLQADVPTSNSLADALHRAGYLSVRIEGNISQPIRGARAAIWVGGQLSENEAQQLSRLCKTVGAHGMPAIAILDFPRRDQVDRAIEFGATAVLSKPWRNADLIVAIEAAAAPRPLPAAA